MSRLPDKAVRSGLVWSNDIHAKALLHSALDMSDSIYDFASWLTDDSFVGTPAGHGEKTSAKQPAV